MNFSRFMAKFGSIAFLLFPPLLASTRLPAQDCGAVRIVPPHEMVEGKTVVEWTVEWWRWVFSIPCNARHPWNEGQCGEGQDPSSPVFFVAGNPGSPTCTVPCGKPILLPIINHILTAPLECPDCMACGEVADGLVRDTFRLECEIDGQPVPTPMLFEHREASPLCFDFDVPEGGCAYPPGHYETAFADGHWLMLEPLCAGEEHTIHCRAGTGPDDCSGFCTEGNTILKAECSFRRGDADGNGNVNITDPIFTLNSLFAGAGALSCPDAADAQDDGMVNLSDPVYTLDALFRGGPAPSSPGPNACGQDPTADNLGACSSTCS
jgi:hypothetical protein